MPQGAFGELFNNQADFAASSLTAIPIKHLVLEPLKNIVLAQYYASQKWIDIFKDGSESGIFFTGESEDGSGQKELQMISFKVDFGTQSEPNTVTVSYPLLLLVPLPTLTIDHFSIAFTMKVDSSTSMQNTLSVGIKAKAEYESNWGFGKFSGSITSSIENKNTAKVEKKIESTYHFDITGSTGSTAGYDNFLSICETAIKQSTDSAIAAASSDDTSSGSSSDV